MSLPKRNSFKQIGADWSLSVPDYIASAEWWGDELAVLGGEGDLYLIAADGKVRATVSAHSTGGLAVACSAVAERIATGGQEKKVRLWTLDGSVAGSVQADGHSVDLLSWSSSLPLLAIGSGKRVLLASPEGKIAQTLESHRTSITGVQWSRDGKRLATAAFDGIRLWDATTGRLINEYDAEAPFISAAWNPMGDVVVGGTQEAALLIWICSQNMQFQAGPFDSKVKELGWDSSGRYLATAAGLDITLWDFVTRDMQGNRPVYLCGHQDLVTKVAWQPAGARLASGGRDGAAYLWKPTENTLPLSYYHLGEEVSVLRWKEGTDRLVVGTIAGTIACLTARDN